jgi:hypothetical protein
VLWQALRDKTRNAIRRAEERYAVEPLPDVDEFLWFYDRNLQVAVKSNHLDNAITQKLIEACLERHSGRILTAIGAERNPVAAIFCVWDGMTAETGNGAISLLLWQAIQSALQKGLVFVWTASVTRVTFIFMPALVEGYTALRDLPAYHECAPSCLIVLAVAAYVGCRKGWGRRTLCTATYTVL